MRQLIRSLIASFCNTTVWLLKTFQAEVENSPTSSFRVPFIFRFHAPFLSCTIPVLDLRHFGRSPDHDGRFLRENADSLSCFCCLTLDLFSLFELDMSSRQLCFAMWSELLIHTFPNLSHPFQFSDFNLSFSHAP